MKTNNEDLLEIDGTRATVSLAASANLKPMWLGDIIAAGIQLVYTGTPAGNFKVQVSNDKGQPTAASEAQQYAGVTNWTDLAAPAAITVSAAGNSYFNLDHLGAEWARIVWTATGAGSGTPTLTIARLKVKGF